MSRESQRTALAEAEWHPFAASVLPRVVHEVVELARNPKTNVSRLAVTLSKEQMLVSSVLRRANALATGLSKRVRSLNTAIVLLGFDLLKETVVNQLVRSSMRGMVNILHRYERFWNHSVGCAVTARLLARKHGLCADREAFLGGLLHDVGMLALNAENARDAVFPSNATGENAGDDVSEVGAYVATQWGLPDSLVDVIRYHRTPSKAHRNPELTATIHVAEVLCERLDIAPLHGTQACQLDPHAVQTLGFTEATLTGANMESFVRHISAEMTSAPSFPVVVQELKEQLLIGLDQLTQQQKLILALFYYEGLSLREIGTVLGVPEKDVLSMHEEALTSLQRFFDRRT